MVQTQPGGGPILAANVSSPAGGLVTFGLPGQPRLFRISSPGTGLAVAFGMPGDSGSLVFSTTRGLIAEHVRRASVSISRATAAGCRSSRTPNDFTVTGLAFDIGNVMALLNLQTVCACIVRSLLEAISGLRTDSIREEFARIWCGPRR